MADRRYRDTRARRFGIAGQGIREDFDGDFPIEAGVARAGLRDVGVIEHG